MSDNHPTHLTHEISVKAWTPDCGDPVEDMREFARLLRAGEIAFPVRDDPALRAKIEAARRVIRD